MQLLELAARVEAATGPDRELDAAIWATLHPEQFDNPKHYARFGGMNRADHYYINTIPVPRLTASLDAAMALIPADMKDEIEITTLYQVARVSINLNHGPDGSPFYGSNKSNSIPLALVAASLRARAGGLA